MKIQRPLNRLVMITLTLLTLLPSSPVLAGQPTWIELAPVGSPPNPVYERKQIHYDAANNRLIVFFPGNPPHNPNPPGNGNEVWILTHANGLGGTPAWSKLQPTGSPSFSNGLESVVYDTLRNRLIVYGGCSATCSPVLSNVFVLTHANGLGGTPQWSEITVTNPQARADHQAIYDPTTNRLIVFGGHLAFVDTDKNDTLALSNANGLTSPSVWSEVATTGGPPGRRVSATAIHDQTNNRMVIFGGQRANTIPTYYNDVWVLSNPNGLGGTPAWQQLTPLGNLPSPRSSHSTVYDPKNNRMIIFGGATGPYPNPNRLGDLWQLSYANGLGGPPTWTQLSPSGTPPGPQGYSTAAFDAANQRMILLGGRDQTDTPNNRVWVLLLPKSPVVYLPILLKPAPVTYLYVKSINTGGINPFEVRDPTNDALLLSCVVGDNVTQFCGSFKAIGRYKVVAYPAKCPKKDTTFDDALPGATVTRTVICEG